MTDSTTPVAGRPDQFGASAVSGAGASDVGISGSVGIDLITSTTTAKVAAGTVTIGGGAVTVQSDNQSSVVGSATPTSDGVDGDKVGVGASVALNTVTVGSTASIANGVGLSGADGLTIGATDLTNTTTTSKGGASGGTAIDAVVSLAILSETTSATLGSGTASTVSGSVGVTAESSGTNTATALGAVDASSKAGVGAAASVITGFGIVGGVGSGNAITSTTAASIDRDVTTTSAGNLTLTATSTRTYDVESTATAGGGSSTPDSSSDGGSSSSSSVSQDTLASSPAQSAETNTQTGLNNSSNEDSTGSGTTTGKSGAPSSEGGTKVSVAGAVSAALVGDSATAEVMGGATDHRTLTVAGSLTVTASNTGDLLATGNASTTAMTNNGVAIGAGLAVLANTTSVKIDDNTHIITPGAVTIGATSVENQDSAFINRTTAQAMSGASGAQNVSVAGALAVAFSESTTSATVGNSVVIDHSGDLYTQAGQVDVTAMATAPLTAKAWAGTYSSSATSIGASIAAVVALDTVTSTVGTGAQINSDGLDVAATEVKIDNPTSTIDTLLGVLSTDIQNPTDYDAARTSLTTLETDAETMPLYGENNYYTEVLAGSASGSKTAIAGGFAVQYIGNTVNAEIGTGAHLDTGAGALTVDAEDHTTARALAGTAAGSGGGTGAGITSTVIYDGSQVTGSLDANATVTHSGSLSVLANSGQTVDLFEASAAAADGTSVAGILGGVILNVGSHATIGAGSGITSAGAVDVAAVDPISILNLAGAVSLSGGTGIGATLIDTTVLNGVSATIASSAGSGFTTSVTGASLTVNAALTDNVIDLGASGTGAVGNAVAGVASPVYQGSTVAASIGADATVSATAGSVMVTASDYATAYNIGGTLAISGENGIGGSLGVSIFSDTTTATIGDSSTVDATANLDVQAETTETVTTAVVSAAGGGEVGAAIALGSSVVTDTTQAYVGQGATVGATHKPVSVSIAAGDATTITDVAGSAGAGGDAGVGAGADVDVLIKHTDAWFGQDSTTAPTLASTLHSSGDVEIDAESSQSATAVVAGLAAGGDAGLAGSVSVYSLTGRTLAGIAQGDTVNATGNVAVLANDQNSVNRVAGSVALGGTAAVGAAIGVTVSNQTTLASIGDNATVVALGDTSGLSVIQNFTGVFGTLLSGTPTNSMTGSQGAEIDPITQADATSEGGSLFLYSRTASPNMVTRQGVIVDATNRDSVQGLAASGGLSGTVTFDLSGDVPVVISDTEATIGAHDSINATGVAGANQSVTVSAASDLYHQGIAAALSLSGSVGLGAGAEVNIVENTTKADVGDHSTVDAALNVSVTSAASEDFSGFAAGAAVAGDVAGAGAATAFVVTDITDAGIGANDQVVASGNVVVAADDESRAIVTAGAVGAAVYVGVGASIGATIFDKTTTAEIGANAIVTGLGNGANNNIADYTGVDFTTQNTTSRGVLVQANSGESLDTVLVAGGGAGFAGIAGVVSVEELTGSTQANIDTGAQINVMNDTGANAAQSVSVTARDSTVLATLDGALAGAISGTAGAVDVAVLNNTTSASIGDNATVDAASNVYVAGLVNQNTSSAVISVGIGVAAVAGAVSVLTVADGPSPQQSSDLQGSDGEANSAVSDNYAASGLIGAHGSSNPNVSGTAQTAVNDKAALTVSSALTASPTPPGVSAEIGNNVHITAGGAVDARSRDSLTTAALAPAVAAGIGVGAGVSVVSADYTNTATIGTGGTLSAGSVDVSAHTDHSFSSDVVAFTAIGGAAAATEVTDSSATSANLGGTDSTTGALTVESYSGDTGNLLTGSVATGIAGGVAVATLSPSAETTVSANASLTAGTSSVGDLSVTATGYENLTTNTASAAVGGAGAGIDVAILSPTTEATVAGGGPLHAEDGAIFVTANNSAILNSFAAGIAILGDVGGAASVYKIADTTTSSVGASTLTASSAADITAKDTSSVTLETGGGAAGIAGLGASLGLIISSDGAGATVDGATINAATIDIAAEADKTYTETVVAGGVGIAGAGFSAGIILDGGEGSSSQGTSVYSSESSALTGGSTSGTSSQNQGDSALATAVPSSIAAGSIGAIVEGSHLTAGTVMVDATSKISTTQNDGALGVGLAAGVGGGVGYTALTGSVTASVDTASRVSASQIGVIALATDNGGDAAHINAIVGAAGGLIGLGAAVAVADDNQVVTAQAGGTLTGNGGSTDSLTVQATDNTTVSTHTYNVVGAGLVAAGAAISEIDKDGSVEAQILPAAINSPATTVSSFDTVLVSAQSSGGLNAYGIAAGGGIGAALDGSYATADDGDSTTAILGAASYGAIPGGITVSALRTPNASAEADGVSLAVGIGAGAAVANASVDGNDYAQVGAAANFADGSSLSVTALMQHDGAIDPSAHAVSVAGAGGVLAGADASAATATNSSSVEATVGSNVGFGSGDSAAMGDNLTVMADRDTTVTSSATGVAVGGLLALGASVATSNSSGDITATLGSNFHSLVGGAPVVLGALTVEAGTGLTTSTPEVTGAGTDDRVIADSTAGGGAALAGIAASATTSQTATVEATIQDFTAPASNAPLTTIMATGGATVLTNYMLDADAEVDTTEAALAGASGAVATRTMSPTVETNVGANLALETYSNILVSSYVASDITGETTTGAGGFINGNAATSTTNVDPTVTMNLGAGSQLIVLGDPTATPGSLKLVLGDTVAGNDQGTMTTGGFLEGPYVDASIIAVLDDTITVGAGAGLLGVGTVSIGDYALSGITTNVQVSTYGGVSAAGGTSLSRVTANNTINIGQNVSVDAYGNITIAAGESGDGFESTFLNASATTDVYNYTVIPITTTTSATADTENNSQLNVASGVDIEGVANVNLIAFDATETPTASGKGHNPYLSILGLTTDDSHTVTNTASTITFDGVAHAGVLADQSITIDASGNITLGGALASGGMPHKLAELLQPALIGQATIVGELDTYDSLQAQINALTPIADATLPGPYTAIQIANAQTAIAGLKLLQEDAPYYTVAGPGSPASGGSGSGSDAPVDAAGAELAIYYSSSSTPAQKAAALTAYNELEALFNGPQGTASVVDIGLETPAVTTSSLYAAAGNITVQAQTFTDLNTAAAGLSAQGGVDVTITDSRTGIPASPGGLQGADLVTGSILVPVNNATGGYVYFLGGARAPTTANVVDQINPGGTPAITIANTALSGSPLIIVNGEIDNYGGSVTISNAQGDIAQYAEVNAATLSIAAPQGNYVVPNLNGTLTAGGAPESLWANFELINSGTNGQALANDEANAQFASGAAADGAYGNTGAFNQYLFSDYYGGNQNNAAYVGGVPKGAAGQVLGLNPECTGSTCTNFILVYNNLPNPGSGGQQFDGSDFAFSQVPIVSTSGSASLQTAQGLANNSPGITARNVIIAATNINVNSTIQAGGSNYSVNIAGSSMSGGISLNQEIATLNNQYVLGQISGAAVDVTSFVTNNVGTQKISVAYDVATQQFTLGDVKGGGGGLVELSGGIANTSANSGAIQVNTGLGTITVNNTTTTPIDVVDLNAGTASPAEVVLTDSNKLYGPNNAPLTTWYVQPVGGSTVEYNDMAALQGGATIVVGATVPSNATSVTPVLQYDPAANLRYIWTDEYSASRTLSTPGNYVYNWVANGWNATGGGETSKQFMIVNGGDALPFFSTSLSGEITSAFNNSFYIGCGCRGLPSNGGHYDVYALDPTAVAVTETSSVKADNAIGISFGGSTTGLIDITSAGSIFLTGPITNAQGSTILDVTTPVNATSTTGVIQEAGGTITAQLLTLTAGAIGSSSSPSGGVGGPLNITLVSGNRLTATSATGLNLAISGTANLAAISAANGDVVISATQGIEAASGATPISGDNITLNGGAGGIGDNGTPVKIGATVDSTTIEAQTGVLNAAATGAINIEKTSGDLLLGQVASLTSGVTLVADTGNIANAVTAYSVNTANETALAAEWTSLNLQNAAAALLQTLTPFDNQVVSDYNQYWSIVQNATIANNTVTLTPSSTLLFSGAAFAANSLTGADHALLTQIIANSTITMSNGVPSVALTAVQQQVFSAETKAALNLTTAPTAAQINKFVHDKYTQYYDDTTTYVLSQYNNITLYIATTFGSSTPSGQSAAYSQLAQIEANSTITTVNNAPVLTLTNAQAALFAPAVTAATGLVNPTNTQVAAYELGQYNTLYAQTGGATTAPAVGFFSAYTPDWTYQLTSQADPSLYAKITYGAGAWTSLELAYALNANAVVPVSNTQILTQAPNVVGSTITLRAPNGQVGNNLGLNITSADGTLSRDGGTLTFSIADPSALSLTDEALLAAAAPGDVTVNYDSSQTPISVSVALPHLVGVSTGGHIVANALGNIYLGSNGSGALSNIDSTSGQVRLDFGGSITDAAAANTPAVTGDFLIVEAGNGSIGSAATPLLVDLPYANETTANPTPTLDSARAGGDIYITEVGNLGAPNLYLGVAFAEGALHLAAPSGSILSGFTYAPNTARLEGGSINFAAANAIGSSVLPLQVQTAGLLTATGASLYLYSPTANLDLGASTISGSSSLIGDGFVFDGAFQDRGGLGVSSTGAVVVAAAGVNPVTPAGSIIGDHGGDSITAPTITVGAGGQIEQTSATGAGAIILHTTSGALTFGAGTTIQGGSLALTSAGAITTGASDVFVGTIAPVPATATDVAFTAATSVTFGDSDTVQSKTSIGVNGQNDILGALDSFNAGSSITLAGTQGVSGGTGDLLNAITGITSVSATAAFGPNLKATTTGAGSLIALTTTVGTLALGQSDALTAPTISLTAKGVLNEGSGGILTANTTDVSLSGAAMVFGSSENMTATRNISIASLGALTGGSAMSLTARNGTIGVTASDINVGQGFTAASPLSIAFTASSGGVAFGGAENLRGQSITLSGHTAINLGASAALTTAGGALKIGGAIITLGASDALRSAGELDVVGTGTVTGAGTETLSSAGLLNITGQTVTFQGPLYATSTGPMNVTATAGAVQIGAASNINASNTLALNAPGGLLVGAGTVIVVGSNFSWTDYQYANFGASDRITVGGSVTGRSSTLTFASGDSLTANGQINLTTSGGGMVLGALTSNLGSGPAITLTSASTIWGNGDGQTNLTTNGGSAGVVLVAGSDIGSSGLALSMKTSSLTATGHGNMWLRTLTNLLTRKTTAPGTIMINGQKVASN